MAADMFQTNRRALIQGSTLALLASGQAVGAPTVPAAASSPQPISARERAARIGKAQHLMRQAGLSGLLVEPGSTMIYFAGVDWSRSERPTVMLLPTDGEACFLTPGFEEGRLRDLLQIPAQVRTWREHDDPFAVLGAWTDDLKIAGGKIAVDETVRFFVSDGLTRVRPNLRLILGAGVVNGCRMIKSPAELALMQRATDITIAAYRAVAPKISAGMISTDISALMHSALREMGGERSGGDALVGEGSSYPHGGRPETVRAGTVVLMDFGCTYHGYYSDVSRTMVFGEADARQRTVWAQVRQGQQVAFEAARIGAPAGSVDDAVRGYYESLGYGPGYEAPGLTHRTGHGIGLDIHEPVNFVHGEKTPLAAGMCFSNEPGIYTPGKYGIRIEDCIYMTESGPRWFSTPPSSIDAPFD